jgi:DNA-binding Lrp family transcriptional regulator
MNCELGSEKSIISQLKSIDSVKEVYGTLGMYDIIAKVEASSEDQIKNIITNKIRKVDKILSTMTLMRAEEDKLFQTDAEKLTGAMLGQNVAKAYIVIHTEYGKEYDVLRNLSHIPEVKEADVVFGPYDVVCKVEASSNKDLQDIITKKIRKLQNISTTMTLNVITEQG